jgi:hypothetical protein
MSDLRKHAKFELERAGFFLTDEEAQAKGKDGVYNGMIGPAIMKMIEVFAEEGHSGMSGSIVLSIFAKLVRFGNLTPLTSDPKEWEEFTLAGEPGKDPVHRWQSRRNPACFSSDGGKTYIDQHDKVPRADGTAPIYTSAEPTP